MIWEQKSSLIVMLTPFRERDRVKSDAYWREDGDGVLKAIPNESSSQSAISIIVKLANMETHHDVVHRTFHVCCEQVHSTMVMVLWDLVMALMTLLFS